MNLVTTRFSINTLAPRLSSPHHFLSETTAMAANTPNKSLNIHAKEFAPSKPPLQRNVSTPTTRPNANPNTSKSRIPPPPNMKMGYSTAVTRGKQYKKPINPPPTLPKGAKRKSHQKYILFHLDSSHRSERRNCNLFTAPPPDVKAVSNVYDPSNAQQKQEYIKFWDGTIRCLEQLKRVITFRASTNNDKDAEYVATLVEKCVNASKSAVLSGMMKAEWAELQEARVAHAILKDNSRV